MITHVPKAPLVSTVVQPIVERVHLMHGCNNRFLLVDERDPLNRPIDDDRRDLVVELCRSADRRGFIPDSVLFLGQSSSCDVRMRVFDRDGSEERMCGNGIRCAASYVLAHEHLGEVAIETGDGPKFARQVGDMVHVDMGSFARPISVGEHYFVDTGNPHLVVLDPAYRPEDTYQLLELARELSHSSTLKEMLGDRVDSGGLYVNFVWDSPCMIAPQVRTFERFIGRFTEACGTGNCAVGLVLSVVRHRPWPIILDNVGGRISLDLREKELWMIGPAIYVEDTAL